MAVADWNWTLVDRQLDRLDMCGRVVSELRIAGCAVSRQRKRKGAIG